MENVKEINLTEWLMALLRKAWLIVLCAVLAGAAAWAYTANFVTPLYSSSVTFYVNNTRSTTTTLGISSSDLATSQRLVLTYVNILKSDSVLDKVAQILNDGTTTAQIRGMIDAASLDETEVFKVKITHPDPEKAAMIANTIADIAPGELERIVDGSSTKIVDYAKVPVAPISPSISRNVAIGVLIGVLAAVAVIILQVQLDVRIKTEDDLAAICSAPVLGVIPDLTQDSKEGYGYEAGSNRQKGGKKR